MHPAGGIRKLLVAHRGEIAARVLRTARQLGIATVAVHLEEERDALHVELADERCDLGSGDLAATYLSPERLVAAAAAHGADALHPGYGFLSESPRLAAQCAAAGLRFVGPTAEALAAAGDKMEAKRRAAAAGVPTLPHHHGPASSLAAGAAKLGFPLLVKAAGGGGGRGIRRVERAEDLERLAGQAGREAEAGFGDGRLYLERFLPRARHVEVQVLADEAGETVALGERECSVQRRHQKLIEESPSPALASGMRAEMLEAAAKAARAMGYVNAGTVEFLVELDARGKARGYYFLEMNARIQVEHPVTETVTGIDLVEWQLRIAAGERLPRPFSVAPRGHAIECRICAETPPAFTPATGPLAVFLPPAGPWLRFDTGYRQGDRVTATFDSLLGKLIAWGPDREAALRRLEAALAETAILGVDTNVDYLADVLRHPRFRSGDYTTALLTEELGTWPPPEAPTEVLAIARAAVERRHGTADDRAAASRRGPWDLLQRCPGDEVRA